MNDGNPRADMLETARSLILRDPDNFSVAALCRETGLSRTKIRHHFPNKSALMMALLGDEPAAGEIPQPLIGDRAPHDAKPAAQTEASILVQEQGWIEHRFDLFERALTLLEVKTGDTAREHSRALSLVAQKLADPTAELPPLVDAESQFVAANDEKRTAPTAAANVPLVMPAMEFHAPASAFHARKKLKAILENAPGAEAKAPSLEPPKPDLMKPDLWKKASFGMLIAGGLILLLVTVSGRIMFPPRALPAKQIPNASASMAQAKAEPKVMIIDATGAASGSVQASTNILIARAESGDARAQGEAAIAYLKGDGVEADPAAAIRWSQTAAAKGDATAQFVLASLYENGIRPDPLHAFKWYSAAAAGGNVKAMHNLAMAYLNGFGVEKNPAAAASWFAKAATGGYRDSAMNLAVLYERGEGVLRNPQDALRWYDNAASLGDGEAAERAKNLRTQLSLVAGR